MTGGLMQLVGKGAQDVLVTGNPSFTHFRSVYKRHSEFAMEHFRLYFKTTNLNLPLSGSLTLRAKVERYAQLLHDCYLSINLPDIYSPVVSTSAIPDADAIGFEFQWIRNIGYNMINYVSVLINGQEIVRHTGEWMKLYAATKMDAAKKAVLNEMVGNIPELYDPANAFYRMNQYPHAITTVDPDNEDILIAAPSITGRTLTIPLHFWFCESIGSALPLIALQHSEVEFVVDLKNIYQLFTIRDVRQNINNFENPNFGKRIVCPSETFSITNFLSPPLIGNDQSPTNPILTTWKLNPFMECNFIFVSDAEMAHIATTDHSFMITQIDTREAHGQYGPSNDLDLIMRNLCTRVVWVGQRSDRREKNDYDNYTNWDDPYEPPLKLTIGPYSSGVEQQPGITMRDILLESSLIIDGKERFGFKQTEFFSNIQNYRHHTGLSIKDIPGIYTYSFALEHNNTQPTGHINGSQFNKTILRNTYVQPPLASVMGITSVPNETCVLKSTVNSNNPVEVDGTLYKPSEVVRIVRKTEAITLAYSYNVRAYVESYNFLRVMGGIANVVFSS